MNKAQILNSVNFQYGLPGSNPDPDQTVTVTANGQSIVLEKNGPARQLDNVGLFTISANDQFFPLSLYFDGHQFCSPELSSDSSLMATTPLLFGKDIEVTVYNQSNPDVNGTIVVNFTSNADGIGIVIVGTSGLTDSEA